jgi:hypothetical protein
MLYISYILDETGSMQSVKDATISGFNEYIGTLKNKLARKVKFFLTKFNAKKIEQVYDGVELGFVGALNSDNYKPDEMTPLYDAVGRTINKISALAKPKDKVLVVVQTDGLENASKEYSQKAVVALVEEKKKLGWEFVFLGADLEKYNTTAALTGASIGIGNTVDYKGMSTRSMYEHLAINTVAYAMPNATNFDVSGDWNESQ